MNEHDSPWALGFRQPAEWGPHRAVWLAWPADSTEWGEQLEEVRAEVGELIRTIADDGHGELIKLLVRSEVDEPSARDALENIPSELHLRVPYGDIWLRDTAPIFVRGSTGLGSVRFCFNGWGGKFDLPGDQDVAPYIQSKVSEASHHWSSTLTVEGGALEVDGEGTLLTTQPCLLGTNRNPGWLKKQIEEQLRDFLGVDTIVWLGKGLINDHTDGHIDTLARFIAPGKVVCMRPSGPDDPNREALESIRSTLEQTKDAQGRSLEVASIVSPGEVRGVDGKLLPASYVNFYISNTKVVVPTYGSIHDQSAVSELQKLFPKRAVVGCSARVLLEGGGAFHCITQQEPSCQTTTKLQ